MNRIARIILKNPIKIIAAYVKLSYWANHPEKYTTGQLWDYIETKAGGKVVRGFIPQGCLDK